MTEILERHCDLCGAVQDEVIGFAEKDAGTYPVRAGWICWACWPKEGSWNRAILRERTVKGGAHGDSSNVLGTDHLSRGPRGAA